jgi:hypothetical protein
MNKKSVLDSVRRLAKQVQEESSGATVGLGMMFWHKQLGALELPVSAVPMYHQCIKDLHKIFAPKEELSAAAVETHLQSTLLKIVGGDHGIETKDRLKNAVQELEVALTTPPRKWNVHVPLRGMSAERMPYTFGKVQFMRGDAQLTEQLATLVPVKAPPDFSKSKARKERRAREEIRNEVRKEFDGLIVARLSVEAIDGEAAIAKGLFELELTLDVINFYSDVFDPFHRSHRATLANVQGYGMMRVLANEPTAGAISIRPRQHGEHGELLLPEKTSKKAIDTGFHRADAMLAKSEPNGLERRLLAAFRWIGQASVESRPEQAFLLYAIGLESILSDPKKTMEVTSRLKLRVCHLCGKSIDDRKQIGVTFDAIYKIRCDIVHAGRTEVTGSDVLTVRNFAKSTLAVLLTDQRFVDMQSNEELQNWFEYQLLIGSTHPEPNVATPPSNVVEDEERLASPEREGAS